jgi:uncharacterized protein (TIGR02231 family)
MKVLALIGIITCFSFVGLANEHRIDASIQHVTVFVQGAQIEREASVSLVSGVQEVVIGGLSSQIDENSIRAGGQGDFTLLSVKKRMNYLRNLPKPKEMVRLEDSLAVYNEKISNLQADKFGLEEERKLILANNTLKGEEKNLSAEELKAMANYYRTRLAANSKSVNKLTVQIQKQSDRRNRIKNELAIYERDRNNPVGEIVLQLMTEKASTAKLKVLYSIRDAGWTPNYDVRSSGAMNEVDVAMYAAVYQGSGIDWNKVPLTLSTSIPQQFQSKPELHPWVLRFVELHRADALSNRRTNYKSMEKDELMMDDAEITVASTPVYAADFTQMIEQQLSTSYQVDLPYTIRSNREQHQVRLRSFKVKSSSKYYAAPKLNQSAFLVAGLVDWEKENLMPGNTKLFVDDMFVGRGYLNPNTTDDTLLLSLGMDPELKVDRKRVKDFSSEKVIGSNKKVTIAIELTVRNTKSKTIELVLEDQYPISSDNNITVTLDDDGGANIDEEKGGLSWNWNLKPGETKKARFTYTIKYPKDKMINL